MDIRFASTIFWIALACCVVAQIAIVRSALLAPLRQVSEPGDDTAPRPRRVSEVLWTIVPAIGLAILLYCTWQAIRDTHRPPTPTGAITTAVSAAPVVHVRRSA